MISEQYKTIFVHLRRTGGNSIEIALGGIELFDAQGRPTTHWENRLHRASTKHKKIRRGHWIHDGAEKIRAKYPELFERYFKFSVVRNPWAQMVSLHLRLHRYITSPWRFRLWLRRYSELEGTVPRRSLHDAQGNLLVDYVARYENLQAEFAHIGQRIGAPHLSLPHANRSRDVSYTDYYDAASRKLVATLFAEDIERYGYRFGT